MPSASRDRIELREIAPVHYADRTETVESGRADYIEPGHAIEFLEESRALEFTPTPALERTFAAIRRNASEGRR